MLANLGGFAIDDPDSNRYRNPRAHSMNAYQIIDMCAQGVIDESARDLGRRDQG